MFTVVEKSFYFCFKVLLTSTVVTMTNGQSIGPLKVTEQFQIKPVTYNPPRSPLPPAFLYGARECGGSGKVLEIRRDACLRGHPEMCSRIVDKIDHVSIIFVPNEDINDVMARGTVTTTDGAFTTVDVPMDGLNLIAGQPYQFTMSTAPSSELRDKIFTSRGEVFSRSNYRARSCLELDFFVRGN